MRQLDRWRNDTNYPHLFYPEMYLLRGGYSKFFPIAEVRVSRPQVATTDGQHFF